MGRCDLLVSSGGRLLFEVVLNPRVCFKRPTAMTKNELKLFAIFLSSPQNSPLTSMDLAALFFSPSWIVFIVLQKALAFT